MKTAKLLPALATCALALSAAATSPANAASPRAMQVAVADAALAPVAQQGPKAEAIRADLRHVRLPPGFKIELFAVVPQARHMAISPSGRTAFVGTHGSSVWAASLRSDGAGVDAVRAFAPSLEFKLANGVCFTPRGDLIVVELNRVRRFALAGVAGGKDLPDGPVTVTEVVPQGGLIPPAEESSNHGARVCRVADDGRLYIALGQPFNVPPLAKVALFEQLGMGGIVRMSADDGSGREVFARGIRNSVGMDFNPKDKTLWFTDNQTDNLGDDVPPGELNHATAAGQHFGYPYWNGHYKVAGSRVANDLKNLKEPAGAVFPQVEFPAHQAQLGMTFYSGQQFPARYRGGMFVAAHGSWNRSTPTGALIDFVPLNADGSAGQSEVFAQGWRDVDTGNYRGRPVDVAPLKDGSLLISDDKAGAIYRVSYSTPNSR